MPWWISVFVQNRFEVLRGFLALGDRREKKGNDRLFVGGATAKPTASHFSLCPKVKKMTRLLLSERSILLQNSGALSRQASPIGWRYDGEKNSPIDRPPII